MRGRLAPFGLALAVACSTNGARADAMAARQALLESRISALDSVVTQLSDALDSLRLENESERRRGDSLRAELAAREDHVRALQLELQRLKEIDLRPRRPVHP